MTIFDDMLDQVRFPRATSYQGHRVFPVNPAAPPRRFSRTRFDALPAAERLTIGDLHFRLWPNYPAVRPAEGWQPRSFRWREVVLGEPTGSIAATDAGDQA